jgi:hypothetical protein
MFKLGHTFFGTRARTENAENQALDLIIFGSKIGQKTQNWIENFFCGGSFAKISNF